MAEPDPELTRTGSPNDPGNDPEGAWLTYAAAAERFGIGADAVRMRAKRLGWRTMPGNDGRTLVWIEGTAPEPAPEREERQPEQPEPLLPKAVAALEAAVTILGEQLVGAEARVVAEHRRAEAEQERGNRLAEQLEAAAADLREKDAAIAQAEQAARIATDALKAARQAEEARKARGRWARLRAAWRGE